MFHELMWLGVVLAVVGVLIVAALASWAIRQAVDRRSETRDSAQADYSRRLNRDDDRNP
jgi:type II secretory pathway pseudopilin PulG